MRNRYIYVFTALLLACGGQEGDDTTPTQTATATQATTPTQATPTPAESPSPSPTPTNPTALDQAGLRRTLAMATFTGSVADDYAGQSFTTGDFNGDGVQDIAIGADYLFSDAPGRVFIVHGPLNEDRHLSDADVILSGAANKDAFGVSVLNLGDINGDGSDDLAVGADAFHGSMPGAVHLFDSPHRSRSASEAEGVIRVEGVHDEFGVELHATSTLFEDEDGSILVTSVGTGENPSGRLYAFPKDLRGDIGPEAATATLYHSNSDLFIGHKTEVAPDMDGDGIEDVLITRYNKDGTQGGAFIEYGPLSADTDLSQADVNISIPLSSDSPAYPWAGSGDINKDGQTEMLPSLAGYSTQAEDGSVHRGLLMIFDGSQSGTLTQEQADGVILGPENGGIGYSMMVTADYNNDGYGEVIATMDSLASALIYTPVGLDREVPQASAAITEAPTDAERHYYWLIKELPDLDGDGWSEVGLTVFSFDLPHTSEISILSGAKIHDLLTSPQGEASLRMRPHSDRDRRKYAPRRRGR